MSYNPEGTTFLNGKYYQYFSSAATGECVEYELLFNYKKSDNAESGEFGFSSGEASVLCFKFKNGKLYDNDGNFVHYFNTSDKHNLEIYGNIFNDRHNYSINRIPINTNCSKTEGSYIDGFYFDNTNLEFYLKCYDSKDLY